MSDYASRKALARSSVGKLLSGVELSFPGLDTGASFSLGSKIDERRKRRLSQNNTISSPSISSLTSSSKLNLKSTKVSKSSRRRSNNNVEKKQIRTPVIRQMYCFYMGYRDSLVQQWRPLYDTAKDDFGLKRYSMDDGTQFPISISSSKKYKKSTDFARAEFLKMISPAMRYKIDNATDILKKQLYQSRNNQHLPPWKGTIHYCAVWTPEMSDGIVKVFSFTIVEKQEGESKFVHEKHMAIITGGSGFESNGVKTVSEFRDYVLSLTMPIQYIEAQ